MRLAIISDIHANLEALQAVFADAAAQRIDRFVCLGDIVGYHADPQRVPGGGGGPGPDLGRRQS